MTLRGLMVFIVAVALMLVVIGWPGCDPIGQFMAGFDIPGIPG